MVALPAWLPPPDPARRGAPAAAPSEGDAARAVGAAPHEVERRRAAAPSAAAARPGEGVRGAGARRARCAVGRRLPAPGVARRLCACALLAGGGEGVAPWRQVAMQSRPTRPAAAKFYPPQDLLDCAGSNFSSVWTEFRKAVAANGALGFPKNGDLYRHAISLVRENEPLLLPGSMKLPQVLVRQLPVARLAGFCLYGFATALFVLFRHDLVAERLMSIEQYMGWVEWPLDFSESSAWPTLWRHASLHLEEFRRRGDVSWSEEADYFGDDENLLPKPTVDEVEAAIVQWLRGVGTAAPQRWLALGMGQQAAALGVARLLGNRKVLRVLVLGHHLGSSMEPFSMLRAALQVGTNVVFQASLFGQRHPKPGLACSEFGYCEENPALEQWFRRFESRWLGVYDWMPDGWDEALSRLAGIIGSSGFVGSDLVVCGGPAWFCVMLRTLWPAPMLLYFAWPLTPLVPEGFKTHIFAHVRALAQAADPPTVFVVANWVLAAQFALQVRMQVPVQRPHGVYVNQTYAPVPAPNGHPRVMVTRIGQWARLSGVALLEQTWAYIEQDRRNGLAFPFELVFLSIRIRGIDTNKAFTYKDFAQFHACIFWPWDVMMLLFNELYTMTMPLLLPARRWMLQLITHALSHTDVNWWHIREAVNGSLPDPSGLPFPLPYKPWVAKDEGLGPVAYWYELTDFMQFPCLTYFDSLPGMLRSLQTLDVPSVRAGMRRFNQATYQDSLTFYRRAAIELLGR